MCHGTPVSARQSYCSGCFQPDGTARPGRRCFLGDDGNCGRTERGQRRCIGGVSPRAARGASASSSVVAPNAAPIRPSPIRQYAAGFHRHRRPPAAVSSEIVAARRCCVESESPGPFLPVVLKSETPLSHCGHRVRYLVVALSLQGLLSLVWSHFTAQIQTPLSSSHKASIFIFRINKYLSIN